jgi:hypothetical protein
MVLSISGCHAPIWKPVVRIVNWIETTSGYPAFHWLKAIVISEMVEKPILLPLLRICFNVVANRLKILFIANDMFIIISLPDMGLVRQANRAYSPGY